MNQSYSLPKKSFDLVLDGLWVNVVLKGGGAVPKLATFSIPSQLAECTAAHACQRKNDIQCSWMSRTLSKHTSATCVLHVTCSVIDKESGTWQLGNRVDATSGCSFLVDVFLPAQSLQRAPKR
jgi:hypothetical protein